MFANTGLQKIPAQNPHGVFPLYLKFSLMYEKPPKLSVLQLLLTLIRWITCLDYNPLGVYLSLLNLGLSCVFCIQGVSKKFGEWYQKTNKTEDTNKLNLLAFKIIAILQN